MSENHDIARMAVEGGLLRSARLGESSPRLPDKYKLVRRIGRGAAGEVWLARDRSLDREVAVKVLAEGSRAVLERFRREARFAAQLGARSVVQVYELDEFEDTHFIAMEYVDGGNLAEKDLAEKELVRVLRDVARALERAHSLGIVHRDIKPENILLDREGTAYLTDFGIARDLTGGAGATLSTEGQVMGTPACMSPEQARGELHAVDARSDVYSLGVTLFYKLTGSWPFRGQSVVDLLHAVIHEDPPFPRCFRHDVPRALEAICLRCMQKDPARRYASMGELALELERYLEGTQVASESSAWFRRLVHRIAGAPAPKVAGEASPPAADEYAVLGLEVARDLAVWDADLYRVSRDLHKRFPKLDALIDRLRAFLGQRPDTAWARYYLGVALFRRGRLEEALDEMEQAIDRVGHLAGAYFELGSLYLAIHMREEGRARRHFSVTGTKGHLRSARAHVDQAAVALREACRLDATLPTWRASFADAVARLAEDDWRGCLDLCEAILAEDPDAEGVWKLKGDALFLSGEDPVECYEEALTIRRSNYEVCVSMARAFLRDGEPAAARRALDRALRIHPEHVDALVLAARAGLAQASTAEDFQACLDFAERARRIEPGSYEVAVLRGEVLLARAEGEGDADLATEAFGELERARNLDGCQNRVMYLQARARLARARAMRTAGEDPAEDLRAVLELEQSFVLRVPDPEPWLRVMEEARALLA